MSCYDITHILAFLKMFIPVNLSASHIGGGERIVRGGVVLLKLSHSTVLGKCE